MAATISSHDRYFRDEHADDELTVTADELGVREFSDGSRCTSPTWSVYSYESSVDHQRMLREIHGRIFNNTSEVSGEQAPRPPFRAHLIIPLTDTSLPIRFSSTSVLHASWSVSQDPNYGFTFDGG